MKYPLILAMLTTLAIGGCGSSEPSGYTVAIINATGADIDDAGIHWSGDSATMGIVVVEGLATYGLFHRAVPSSHEVRWKSGDGQSHLVTITTPPVPEGFNGTVYFRICPDGTVTCIVAFYGQPKRTCDPEREQPLADPKPQSRDSAPANM